jgi:hypothetical protein
MNLWLVATYVAVGLAVAELAIIYVEYETKGDLWQDYIFFRDLGARWLAGGPYYLPHQLAGPYDVELMVDTLYPPAALLLFVPLAFTPAILWWIIPIAVVGYVIWSYRPSPPAVFAMACLMLWPRSVGPFIYGGTDMWVTAGVAAGLRWGWPAALIALKPSFLPLAIVGVRHRSFWVAAAVLALITLPMLGDYITAMRNLHISAEYSLGALPLMFVPIVAWLGRTRGRGPTDQDKAMDPHPAAT